VKETVYCLLFYFVEALEKPSFQATSVIEGGVGEAKGIRKKKIPPSCGT
jgi:hypothetical protein